MDHGKPGRVERIVYRFRFPRKVIENTRSLHKHFASPTSGPEELAIVGSSLETSDIVCEVIGVHGHTTSGPRVVLSFRIPTEIIGAVTLTVVVNVKQPLNSPGCRGIVSLLEKKQCLLFVVIL